MTGIRVCSRFVALMSRLFGERIDTEYRTEVGVLWILLYRWRDKLYIHDAKFTAVPPLSTN